VHRTHGEVLTSRSSTPSQPDAAGQISEGMSVIREAAVRVDSQASYIENKVQPQAQFWPATSAAVDWQPRPHPWTLLAHSTPFARAPMALSSLEHLGYSTLLAAAEQAALPVTPHSQPSGNNCCGSADTGANVNQPQPAHSSRAGGGGGGPSYSSGMALLKSAIAQDVATKANCPYADCKCGLGCSCAHCAWWVRSVVAWPACVSREPMFSTLIPPCNNAFPAPPPFLFYWQWKQVEDG
jgi:hypothetical protein